MISLNAILSRIESFAENHYFIQTFSFGKSADELDLEKLGTYPALYLVYNGADYDEGTKTYNFELYLIDLPGEKEEKNEQRKEAVSDSEQCLEDLLADISSGGNIFIFDEDYEVTSGSVLPIYASYANVLAGALLDISISVPYDRSACNLPLNGVQPEGGGFTYARRGLLRMLTINGATDVLSVNTIRVPNGTLTDNGNGDVTLSISGGAGGVSSVNDIEPDINGNIALDTDDIPEGSSNVYYTDARVDSYLESGSIDLIDIANGKASISWNDTDGTLDLAYANGVTLQIGQEEHFYAKATEAISDGDIIMFVGAQGSHLLIAKADMSAAGFFPESVIGVATQDFALNDFGYVTSFGKVRGLNLGTYTEGDLIYLDPNTPGGYVTTEPTPPDHIILVAAVVYAHSTQGTLFVRPSHKPDTNEVPEGTTNLYYTDARVDARVTTLGLATTTYVDTEVGNEESARISADSGLQTQINTNASDISTLDGIAVKSVNAVTPILGAVTLDSDDISEGATNLYFTTAERTKLTGIEDGAEVNPTASEIKTAYESNADTNAYTDAEKSKLAGIAAGAEVNVNADWNSTTGDSQILNKPTLAAVATSGAYSDLSGTPTIPSASYPTTSVTGSTALTPAYEQKFVIASSSSAITLEIQTGLTKDAEILVYQGGTGSVTITGASGVTIRNTSGFSNVTAEQYAVIGLKQVGGADEWVITGERKP